jgi:hypothetical protein
MDGNHLTSWEVGGANNTVNALAISGGKLYVGGVFTSFGGRARGQLAAVDISSGVVNDWNPNVPLLSVFALEVSGSTVYVRGSLTSIGGTARRRSLKL